MCAEGYLLSFASECPEIEDRISGGGVSPMDVMHLYMEELLKGLRHQLSRLPSLCGNSQMFLVVHLNSLARAILATGRCATSIATIRPRESN